MIHQMKLQSNYFNQIKQGKKKIEVRLLDKKRQQIKVGDIIEFQDASNNENTTKAQVIELSHYKSFSEIIDDFPIEDFGARDKRSYLEELYSFYTEQQEEEDSVLGIKVSLI